MMTQVRNTDKFVDEYLKMYPPYHSTENLGVNVSEIMRYAKKCGKKAKDLSEVELSKMFK